MLQMEPVHYWWAAKVYLLHATEKLRRITPSADGSQPAATIFERKETISYCIYSQWKLYALCVSHFGLTFRTSHSRLILTYNKHFSFFVVCLGSENLVFRRGITTFIVSCYLTVLIVYSHSAALLPDRWFLYTWFFLATSIYVIKTDLKRNSLLFHFTIHVFILLSKRNKRFWWQLAVSVEKYERKIAVLNEELENMQQERTSFIQHVWYEE